MTLAGFAVDQTPPESIRLPPCGLNVPSPNRVRPLSGTMRECNPNLRPCAHFLVERLLI